MISKEEFSRFQQKLVDLSQKKEELTKLLEAQKDLRGQIEPLKQQIDLMKRENNLLEQQQIKELSQITNELHSIKPDSGANDFTKSLKIKQKEKSLSFLEDKLRRQEEKYKSLFEENKKNNAKEEPLNVLISNLEKKISFYTSISTRMPKGAPISLQLSDYYLTYQHLLYIKQLNRVQKCEEKIKKLIDNNENKKTELEKLTADVSTKASSLESLIQEEKTQIGLYESLSKQLQDLNLETKLESDKNILLAEQHKEEMKQNEEQLTALKEKLVQIEESNKNFQLIEDFQNDTDLKIKIQKQNQLELELQHKIDDFRSEIIEKREKEPFFIKCTKDLERKWIQHDSILLKLNKTQAILDRKREDKERKIIAIQEINAKWPEGSRTHTKKGMNSLKQFFLKILL